MARQLVSVHLVGHAAGERTEAARTAADAVEPGTSLRHSVDLVGASAAPSRGCEVLLLFNPTPEEQAIALAALDARGLPRWAVVSCGRGDPGRADFSLHEWEPSVLARSIVSALSLLALRRDNARLRGDLRTVGRRLTHDVRMPLHAISTANQALAELTMGVALAPTLHLTIAAAVEEMGILIDRIGTVLTASSRPIDRQPVAMEDIVWNARERLDKSIRLAGAVIHSPEKWPDAMGDVSLLELVWASLLANSVAHAGPAPRIELGWTRSDASTCFWLQDSGPGVAPAERARLFHPLDRLHEFNAPRGYGLSLVHRLIELHGGTTDYSPNPMPGGTFSFTLPD